MSVKKRVNRLEKSSPRKRIEWDGRPETAEAYVKALTASFTGNGLKNKEDVFADYEGNDPRAYVEQALQKG